jgi:hypothetical protein
MTYALMLLWKNNVIQNTKIIDNPVNQFCIELKHVDSFETVHQRRIAVDRLMNLSLVMIPSKMKACCCIKCCIETMK